MSSVSGPDEVKHFDAVIVGSGFGGSVMAARLAEAGKSVCVLERGKAYPPGSFPRSPQAMANNTWDPSEGYYGLFDFWTFPGLSSIVSSGLGGGSLIYSNVMLRKPEDWFVNEYMPGGGYESWPINRAQLDPHYDAVEKRLGVQRYPFDQSPYDRTARTAALVEAGSALNHTTELPNLAVTFANVNRQPVPGEQIDEPKRPNLHGAPRSTCRLVAECNLGCNFGSKNSLDFNYLTDAQRAGALIKTMCEVRSFERLGNEGFAVTYVQHRVGSRSEQSVECHVTASKLILAAGTFGSTYLLLKHTEILQSLSERIGTRFSANGDYLGLVLKARDKKRRPRPMTPSFGAAITATFQVPRIAGSESHRGVYIQDAGYPDLVNWMVQESLPLMMPRLLRFLVSEVGGRLRGRRLATMNTALREILGTAELTATTAPLVGMGRDVPDSTFSLTDDLLDLDWQIGNSMPYFDHVESVMQKVGEKWNADCVATLKRLNRIVTVHPLGGVPMARDREHGVVDEYGAVFDTPGLFVTDGSVMPGPVGANPSLTIAAFADRCADHLIANWT